MSQDQETEKILVEEPTTRPGERVVIAAIGPHPQLLTLFEMRQVEFAGKKKPRVDYYVDMTQVSRDAYFDAMMTAQADRFCPIHSGDDEDDSQGDSLDDGGDGTETCS